MERDILLEVINSQVIEDDSTASDLNGRDDSDNIVTVPEETNESDQNDENDDEGYTGNLCIQLKANKGFL